MKAVSSHEVLAESFYQVIKEKLSFSGKPGNFMGILQHLGHAARELGASSVLPCPTQIISDGIRCFSNSQWQVCEVSLKYFHVCFLKLAKLTCVRWGHGPWRDHLMFRSRVSVCHLVLLL